MDKELKKARQEFDEYFDAIKKHMESFGKGEIGTKYERPNVNLVVNPRTRHMRMKILAGAHFLLPPGYTLDTAVDQPLFRITQLTNNKSPIHDGEDGRALKEALVRYVRLLLVHYMPAEGYPAGAGLYIKTSRDSKTLVYPIPDVDEIELEGE